MRDKAVKLVIGALLHDIGKVIYRSGDGRNHSISGYDFLKEEIGIEDKEILDAVRYHHGKLLSKADILKDSNAYIVYIADNIAAAELEEMDLGSGVARLLVTTEPELFYNVLAEFAGEEIEGEHTLLRVIRDFSHGSHEWNKVSEAMEEAKAQGYGVVTPSLSEMYHEEPELIKQGGRFGVRLKASAPSFHVLRANISTEITPLIGTEKQCEELVRYILSEFEEDPQKIWQTNIFGKSLNELVQEGIQGKLYKMPEDAQVKLQETLQRIVNEGGGGLICIIL